MRSIAALVLLAPLLSGCADGNAPPALGDMAFVYPCFRAIGGGICTYQNTTSLCAECSPAGSHAVLPNPDGGTSDVICVTLCADCQPQRACITE
jgi:hypothetical protein